MKLKNSLNNLRKYRVPLLISIFIIVLLVTIFLPYSKTFTSLSPMPGPNPPPPPAPVELGNTGGNILNWGETVFDGTYVYYKRQSDKGKLYRERPDGTGLQKVSDANAWFLNVSGDWIYYSGDPMSPGMFKTRKDGTGGTVKLLSDRIQSMHLYGQYIYYSKMSPDGELWGLYKIKTDGTESSPISIPDKSILGFESQPINVFDGWIYAAGYARNNSGTNDAGIFKIKTDGSAAEKVSVFYPQRFFVEDGWVYYINANSLSKIKTDGTDNTSIVPAIGSGDLYSINSKNNFLYYTVSAAWSGREDVGVYSIRKDGSDMQKLRGGIARYLTISSDWIYYDDTIDYYRMRIDGTQFSVVP